MKIKSEAKLALSRIKFEDKLAQKKNTHSVRLVGSTRGVKLGYVHRLFLNIPHPQLTIHLTKVPTVASRVFEY